MKKFIAIVAGATLSISTSATAMSISEYCAAYAEMGKSIVLARQVGIPKAGTQQVLKNYAAQSGQSEETTQMFQLIASELLDTIYKMDYNVVYQVDLDEAAQGMREVCIQNNS